MSWFIVDTEADGPCPGPYSMVSIGIIRVQQDLLTAPTFRADVAPISSQWKQDALDAINVSRDTHLTYPKPETVIPKLVAWVKDNSEGRPIFVSDNPAFDWQWMNHYTHVYAGDNPFGFSARRIGDIYSGLKRNLRASSAWKKFRKTAHTHDPLDDARGNAEALVNFLTQAGIRIPV